MAFIDRYLTEKCGGGSARKKARKMVVEAIIEALYEEGVVVPAAPGPGINRDLGLINAKKPANVPQDKGEKVVQLVRGLKKCMYQIDTL